MKIGILGGSFNPPHLGHLIASQQLIDFQFVDQVWLMPCYQHVWNKKLAPVKDRVAMCRFLENKKIKVSTQELDQKKPMPTIATLKLLEKKFTQHHFFWLIGQKTLKELPKWDHCQELIKNYQFFVLPQNNHEIPTESRGSSTQSVGTMKQLNNLTSIHHPYWVKSTLSSTIIRRRVKKGLSLKGFVPEKVTNYIKKRKLYR